MNKPKQLTFPWNKANKSRFENFYFESSNMEAKDALFSNADIYLYGINKTGKTFLLQSLCNYYSNKGKSSLFIPLKEVKSLGSQITDSLEGLDLICIDDLHLVEGDKGWELALFNLINNCLLTDCRLVFCSSLNSTDINFALKDLISRIRKIDQIEIYPIKENNLSNAIKFIANSRSIELGQREVDYLINYAERSISNLINLIEKLDQLSMELKRKISIPLIKELTRVE